MFSTFGGGSLATSIATSAALDSSTFAFGEEEVLEALAVLPSTDRPLTLHHPAETGGLPSHALFVVDGAAPFSLVQLVLSHSSFPQAPATFVPSLGAQGFVLLDFADPLTALSLTGLDFTAYADAGGRASFSYDLSPLPPGLHLSFQAFTALPPRLAPAIAAEN